MYVKMKVNVEIRQISIEKKAPAVKTSGKDVLKTSKDYVGIKLAIAHPTIRISPNETQRFRKTPLANDRVIQYLPHYL
jgi:hypothetical protein